VNYTTNHLYTKYRMARITPTLKLHGSEQKLYALSVSLRRVVETLSTNNTGRIEQVAELDHYEAVIHNLACSRAGDDWTRPVGNHFPR
jgi:hypothetical protein